MPIQSYLMMYFAGSAWQYGKRKISAMSNEQFNKLDMKTLLEEHTMELKSVIPTLEKSMNDVTPLVSIMIEQYGDFVREAIKALPEAFGNIFQQSGQAGQSGIYNVRLDRGLATLRGDAGTPQSLFERDIEKLQKSQREANAKFEKEKRDEAIRLSERRALEASIAKSESEQKAKVQSLLSVREKTKQFVGKKAGQSQRLERNKIIKRINLLARRAKQMVFKKGTRGRPRPATAVRRRNVLKEMAWEQTKLRTLVKRYRF